MNPPADLPAAVPKKDDTPEPADERPPTGTGAVSPRLLRIENVAVLLSVSVETLQRWDSAGKLPPAIRIGKVKRWDLAELHQWLDRRQQNGDLTDRKQWMAIRAVAMKAAQGRN